MLISIGRREAPEDLAGLLLECHGRIRHFAALAVQLASADVGPEERAGAAASIARYFGEALPLHIRDEEDGLLPRLAGRAGLDVPLERMRREHAEHDALRLEVIAITSVIALDAHCFEAHARRLGEVAKELEKELVSHIEQEEREILPRLSALLCLEEERAIIVEMRARRA